MSPGGVAVALDAYADLRIWVCWQKEDRDGRTTKVPWSPNAKRHASSTDPSTWSTRAIAEGSARANGRTGVGIVLAEIDEDEGRHLGGIDLDACIDGEGVVAPWAREIVELLNSYTEISPSGRGLKIVFEHDQRVTLAEGVHWRSAVRQPALDGGKDHAIEFFLDRRYFTVTDQVFEHYATVRHVDLDTLRDVQCLMEAFAGKPLLVTKQLKVPTHHPHRHDDDDQKRLFDALDAIPGEDDYNEWVRIGMSLHAEEQGSDKAYRAFVAWSAKSGKFDQDHCRRKWQEWNNSPARNLTGGTIIYLARRNGWQDPRQKTNGAAAKTPDPNGNDSAAAGKAADQPGDTGKERPKQADMLIALAAEAELFHTADGTGFADLKVNGHRETWPIKRKAFRRWLMRRFYKETGGAPNSEAMQAALGVIEAKAQFDGSECEVFIRIGEHGGKIYLDLCDDKWRAVEIDTNGWQIIEKPPLRFRRAAGMKPLPDPQQGGSIKKLRKFLNVTSDNDFVLVEAWLLAALRGRGPYPILALEGEQGTGKSLVVAILRSLLDPNTAALRSLPREERDLFIAASNGHVLAFDNVSGMPAWLSDALCRVSTGAAFATRQNYTDTDEVLLAACRPIILNGIEDIVGRSDLADRTIFRTLPLIAEDKRRTEAELWSEFEEEHPAILGALLDAVAEGLKRLPETRLERLPRMADFALWVSACEPALWETGTFMEAYGENIGGAVDAVIDADPVADAVRTMMSEKGAWEGTAAALLVALAEVAGDRIAKSKSWPETARALSGRLRRAAPGLRKIGVEIDFKRKGQAGTRTISITGTPKSPGPDGVGNFASVPSATSAAMPKSKPANDLAAQTPLTQTPALTQTPSAQNFASAQKPFENGRADATDGTDANPPTPSGPRGERRL